jgi:hypothetical protein
MDSVKFILSYNFLRNNDLTFGHIKTSASTMLFVDILLSNSYEQAIC